MNSKGLKRMHLIVYAVDTTGNKEMIGQSWLSEGNTVDALVRSMAEYFDERFGAISGYDFAPFPEGDRKSPEGDRRSEGRLYVKYG
jgi:hypothetical protein